MTTKKERERQEAIDHLRKYLKPGDTVYTILKHVSRSGMYRVIDLYAMVDNQPVRISGYAADLLEGYDQRHEGCKASGVGMDMGFHLVYNLSYALFPDGFTVNKPLWHNREYKTGEHFKDGGYALKQSWMG